MRDVLLFAVLCTLSGAVVGGCTPRIVDNTQLERAGLTEADLACSDDDPCVLFVDPACGGCGQRRAWAVAVPRSVADGLVDRRITQACDNTADPEDPACEATDAACDNGTCRLVLQTPR